MNNKARLYFNDIQSHRHGGALVDLAPQNKAPRPLNWNMKHYKSVEFLSNFRMSSNPAQTYSPLLKISGDGSDDIHKSMLGLIGLIIANQSSLQWKVTMQKRHLCRPPLLFSLAPQWPPHFFILESPLNLYCCYPEGRPSLVGSGRYIIVAATLM